MSLASDAVHTTFDVNANLRPSSSSLVHADGGSSESSSAASPPLLKLMTMVYVVDTRERKVLLGHKARGFGAGKWNGFGGKVDAADPSIQAGAQRELEEECGLRCRAPLTRCGVMFYEYPVELERRTLEVHVYWTDISNVDGVPRPSEEMNPIDWFGFDDVPLDRMWADDPYWLPFFLEQCHALSANLRAPRSFAGVFRFSNFETVSDSFVVWLPPDLPGLRSDLLVG